MKTVFLKNRASEKTTLPKTIMTAFECAKEYRAECGVDDSIRLVDEYFGISRGIINIMTSKVRGNKGGASRIVGADGNKLTALENEILNCDKSIYIHMDNISNLIDSWMAIINDSLIALAKPVTVTPTERPDSVDEVTDDEIEDAIYDTLTNSLAPFTTTESDLNRVYTDLINDKNNGHETIRVIRDNVYDIVDEHAREAARETAEAIDEKMTDQIQESNYTSVIREVFRSFARDRFTIMKAPQFTFQYKDKITKTGIQEEVSKSLFMERVKIDNYYAAPNTTINDPGSYEFDVSSITISELIDAKKCDGYSELAINRILEIFKDCPTDWLDPDWKMQSGGKKLHTFDTIPVLKGRIRVTGKEIKDHGVENDKDIENDRTYELIQWLIHDEVIYGSVVINKRPNRIYHVAGWQRFGDHVYDSRGVTEIAMPYQINIDKSYRHMFKNQEYSALGIWGYEKNKIDLPDFSPEDLVGGIALPVRSSAQSGNNNRPVFNIRVDSNVNEILTAVSNQQQEMEEKAQIDLLSVGVANRVGSSLRTTGLGSLRQKNSNKKTLFKISELEYGIVLPMGRSLKRVIIWTSNDPRITSGSVDVQLLSYTDAIRQGDEAENIDFFFQTVAAYLGQLNLLRQQGVDVSGLQRLLGRYAETKGFSDQDVFGKEVLQIQESEPIIGINQTELPTDGRSRLPVQTDISL